jgi:hypothetical protein
MWSLFSTPVSAAFVEDTFMPASGYFIMNSVVALQERLCIEIGSILPQITFFFFSRMYQLVHHLLKLYV